ncbi:Hypothetical protein FKW44_013521, partial [Caligus rogercresseyi]
EAYKIEHIISTVQRALYASRTCGGGLSMSLQDLVRRNLDILRSIHRENFKTHFFKWTKTTNKKKNLHLKNIIGAPGSYTPVTGDLNNYFID